MNSAETIVVESLKGLCDVNPQLALDPVNKSMGYLFPEFDLLILPSVVFVKQQDRNKVALVCGGGSGHEPAHAGYVGKSNL